MKPVAKYLSFTGNSGCYGELPLGVLAGATTFTIEAKFSTTSTKSSSSNYTWATIVGKEIGGTWQDDFGLCVNGGKLCFWSEPKTGGSSSTRNTTSDAVVNDGAVHEVAVASSEGAIDLYCDSKLVAHTDNVNAKITDAYKILIAYNSDSNSRLQMDLYELRCWNVARSEIFADIDGTEDGLQAWYLPSEDGLQDFSGNERHATLYGSPTLNDVYYLPVNFSADVQRRVHNIVPVEFTADVERKLLVKWRYENAGTADTLIIAGTTLTDLPESQSKTGTAFYQTTRAKCFDLPATSEIWIKFDIYFDDSNRWRAYNGGSNGITGITAQTDLGLSFFSNAANVSPNGNIAGVCKKNQLQTVLLHMVSGSSAGVVEAWVDGEFIYRYTGDVNHGQDFADIYLQSDGAGTFFSNVIISNVEVKLGEGKHNIFFDTERRIKKPFEIPFDVQREIILPVIVPFIGEHFNHLIPNFKIYRDKPRRIILPKDSIAYICAVGAGVVDIYSDTNNNAVTTGNDFDTTSNIYTKLDTCRTVYFKVSEKPTAVQIIKWFMKSLDETALSGTAALDEAINSATGGLLSTTTALISSFLSDLDNSASYSDFLKTYCDIILGNVDTGAITGSDAGGLIPKDKYSIVPEPVPIEDWVVPTRGSSKKIDGLTVHFPVVGSDGSTFSDAENHILAGLNSVWIEQSLILVKNSFGLDFNETGTSVKTIRVEFENNDSSNVLAYVSGSYSSGKATLLTLTINMYYYNQIITSSEDGKSSGTSVYLDRTLAHEFTHAVMAANIDNFHSLPTYIKEGTAELVRGIDDIRRSTISSLLTSRRADLETTFANGTTRDSSDPYAAGYMLLRYLAKQGQNQINSSAPFDLEINNLLISDGAIDYNYNALTDNTRQRLFLDVLRTLIKSTSFYLDVTIFDVVLVQVLLDVSRNIQAKLTLLPTDTNEYFPSGGDDTEPSEPIVIPSYDVPIQTPEQEPVLQQLNTVELQSFEIYIAEQQLTPRVTFTTAEEYQMEQALDIKYLDTYFNLRIESIRKQGKLYTYECCHNLDELLYTQLEYTDSSDDSDDSDETGFLGAKEYAKKISEAILASDSEEQSAGAKKDKVYKRKFADFKSTLKQADAGGLTYADLISSIFGWTARISPILINVFFVKKEGKEKLYFVQRSKEEFTIDITDSKHSIPIETQELVRMVWASSPKNETVIESDVPTPPSNDDDDDEQWTTVKDVATGSNWTATTTYFYIKKDPFAPLDPETGAETGERKDNKAGLLGKVEIDKVYTDRSEADSFTQINHTYDDDGTRIETETYVHYYPHENKPPDTKTINKLRYITLPNGEKFLANEATEQYEDGDLVDSTMTTHSPSRLGQTHAVKITAGGIAGEAFGQDTGDDRITPYKQRRSFTIELSQTTTKKTNTIKGRTTFDTSFPVHDEKTLENLTKIIETLNRTIKTTLSITLYGFPHLINFNDCILFEGEKYCLVSNTARTNSRVKNEQNLVLVNRWAGLLPNDDDDDDDDD